MSAKAEVLYDLYDCGRLDGRYSNIGINGDVRYPASYHDSNYSVSGVLYRKRYLIFEKVDDEPISKAGVAPGMDKTR